MVPTGSSEVVRLGGERRSRAHRWARPGSRIDPGRGPTATEHLPAREERTRLYAANRRAVSDERARNRAEPAPRAYRLGAYALAHPPDRQPGVVSGGRPGW